MSTFSLTGQNVNGDPLVDGKNINITNNSTSDLIFQDVDDLLGIVQIGEYVSLDGGTTFLTYEFLGYGDVRGDPLQTAGFIRIDLQDGTFLTVAIDMNDDGDKLPNLANGNTKLKVADLDATIEMDFPPPPCFASGSLILTNRGWFPVERIVPGMRIQTRDNGWQKVLWAGGTESRDYEGQAPIRFATGAIGNTRPLLVSPQHRILISGWKAELFYGETEVFVAAKHLVNGYDVTQLANVETTYHHLLLDRHEVILSEDAWTESFFPGDQITTHSGVWREELEAVVQNSNSYRLTARPSLTGSQARLLNAA